MFKEKGAPPSKNQIKDIGQMGTPQKSFQRKTRGKKKSLYEATLSSSRKGGMKRKANYMGEKTESEYCTAKERL